MFSGTRGRKQVAGVGCWGGGRGFSGRDPTNQQRQVNLLSVGVRGPCLGPAQHADIDSDTLLEALLDVEEENNNSFPCLAETSFPLVPFCLNFSYFSPNSSSCRPPSSFLFSSNCGMQLGKGSTPKPPTPSALAQTPLGPRGKQIPGKAFSGSTESGARVSAQESSRCASSFVRLLENLLVLTGSFPVSSSPCSHLTHGMAFHPPVQDTFTLTLNLTNDHCHNSCLMALGFPFPVL